MPKNRLLFVAWLISLGLFAWLRFQVFFLYNAQWVDSDQTISWLMAKDIANGNLYTPYFYGQFYNINIDAFVSGLVLRFGGSVEHVVPIISNILGATPFLVLGLLSLRSKHYIVGVVVFSIGILLPTQFHMMTSVARGFMGGLFVCSVGAVFVVLSKNRLIRIIGYFLMATSYFVNPNVVFVLIASMPLWFYANKKALKFEAIHACIGVALTILGWIFLKWFQSSHNLQEVHRLWQLEWKLDYLLKNLTTIDLRWRYIFPLAPKTGSLWIAVAIALASGYWFKKNRIMFWSTILTLCALILSLGLNKTLDGTNSVFFPYSRMYLAIPMTFLVLAVPILKGINHIKTWQLGTIMLLVLSGFMYQYAHAERVIVQSIRSNDGTVQLSTIDRLRTTCDEIEHLIKAEQVDFVTFYYKSDEFNYGCPCLNPSIKTLYPEYDRRLWNFNAFAFESTDKLLILDWSLSIDKKLKTGIDSVHQVPGYRLPAYRVIGKDINIVDVFKRNQLTLRPH